MAIRLDVQGGSDYIPLGVDGDPCISLEAESATVIEDTSKLDALIEGNVPSTLVSNAKSIFKYAFAFKSLSRVECPLATSVGSHAFYYAHISEVYIPLADNVGDYAFNWTYIESVNLPSAITISSGAFYRCKLTSCFLDSAKDLKYEAFYEAASLKTLYAPNLTHIGKMAFSGCKSLELYDTQNKVTIGYRAFENSGLITCVLRSEVMCNTENTPFYHTAIEYGHGYIYVPSALVDTYKAAQYWSAYANQFRALEDYTVDGTTTGELDDSKI